MRGWWARALVSMTGDPIRNGFAFKLSAVVIGIVMTIGYWVLVFQSRADTIRQGGYEVDPVTQSPLGQAGTPIDLGYAFLLFMVIFLPPIAAVYFLGVLVQKNYEAPETEEDDLRRIDNMYK